MYCSNIDGDDCTKNGSVIRLNLEPLFHQYGVDIVFSAHEHSYERLWPTYNNTVSPFVMSPPHTTPFFEFVYVGLIVCSGFAGHAVQLHEPSGTCPDCHRRRWLQRG